MIIERRDTIQKWGSLDLNLTRISQDWFGETIQPDIGFCFILDPNYFWFIASREKSALIHPDSRPNQFMEQLWHYDLAEFFVAHPTGRAYLEFNLAPNGAWWSAEFSTPRKKVKDTLIDGVKTFHNRNLQGHWLAAARINRRQLEEKFPLQPGFRINATFIVNSPNQQFVSVADLGSGMPDFHRPDLFKLGRFTSDTQEK